MARKPQPGGDYGIWGQLLNEFLDVSHNNDGTLKNNTVNATTLNTTAAPSDGQVLTWSASALSWVTPSTDPDDGQVDAITITSGYTLSLDDRGKIVEVNSASPVTVTIPPNASAAFPVGTVIEVYQYGTGQVTVAPGGGVTLRAADGRTKLTTQYSSAALRKRGTNEWTLVGDLVA